MFKVCFTKITEIVPHNNADALEIARVYGFSVVIKKGSYNVGDFALYIPIDSVLPVKLEQVVFGENSKIKLTRGRVKQIRIRQFPSEGMLIDVATVKDYLYKAGLNANIDFKLEHDYAELLSVTKYEPPVNTQLISGDEQKAKKLRKGQDNPLFHKYNGLENLKWFPNLFKEDEEVVIQEKLHGTNARLSKLPTLCDTLFKKIKKFFGLLPKYEVCYGSNNVDLTNRSNWKGFYGENVYARAFQACDAHNKVKENEIIYGEIVAEGVQKNYHYGHRTPHFVLFDVKIYNPETKEFKWLNPDEVEQYAKERGFDFVPVLYRGVFNKQVAYELTFGDSVYCPEQKIREGVAIKSRFGYNDISMSSNKRALKYISEVYLDKDNSDFH